MKKFSEEKLVFASIIAIAAVLRLWNYWDWSFTHDELGALVRLQFSSFHELMMQGVRPDTHPAFVQVFLYCWTPLFGLSETAVRFPFVIAGIGSVALLYLIAKKWFGYATACFSSLTLAVLVFPILYSQLARPYSFGLFFSLLAVWYWTKLLFDPSDRIYGKAILYGIATLLCMLTHYFAFFFAMIVAVTGLFFLKKETVKPYLLSGLIALVLFLPHIPISIHQFGLGGVGEWLAKPNMDFLWKYILYGFNDSPAIIITVTAIVLLSVLMYHWDIHFSKFRIICLLWFILPFLAGYYYSLYVNPVLQYSTLLFSFPFLLLFLFSFFKERKTKFNTLSLASLGVILLFNTILVQKFYKQEYFGVFKELDAKIVELQKKYGKENTTIVLNTSRRDIFDFYFKQNHRQVHFDYYAGDDSSFIANMLKKVDQCKTEYFLYGWSNFLSPYEIPEIIKRKYPCIIYNEKHFNAQLTLFGKKNIGSPCIRDTIVYYHTDFESKDSRFYYDTTHLDSVNVHSGKYALRIDSKTRYCITYKIAVKNVFKEDSSCVSISAWIYTVGVFNAQLVMEIGQQTGKRYWKARLLSKFIRKQGMWQEVFATFQVPDSVYPDDEVKLHLWNPFGNSFLLDDVTISSFTDSRYNYYQPSFRK